MATLKRKRGRGNNSQNSNGEDPVNGKMIVLKKTSSVKKSHGLSDPTREKRGEGSGASTLNNNNHSKTTKIPTDIRISEVHWQLTSRYPAQIIQNYNGFLNKYILKHSPSIINPYRFNPTFLKYELSWYMKELAYFDDSDPTLAWKLLGFKKINPNIKQFDIGFMSKELLGVNINSNAFVANAQKPDYTKYLELKVKQSYGSEQAIAPWEFEGEIEHTLFLRFNLDIFNNLGKNQYGDILNFRDYFVFTLLILCIHKPRGFTPFVLDFARNIKATHVTLNRTAQLKNMSYSSFYFILSQFKHTQYITKCSPKTQQIIIKSIGSNSLVMKIIRGDNNTVDIEVKLTSYHSIDSIFLTTNMEDILKNTNLEEAFERLINSIFGGGLNGNLLLPTKDIYVLEAKREFLHHCNGRMKADALIICPAIIELHENKKDPKRYDKFVKKSLPNGTDAQRKNFRVEINNLRIVYRELLKVHKRRLYHDELLRVLGGS